MKNLHHRYRLVCACVRKRVCDFLSSPLSPGQATFLTRPLQIITRQAIELESYPNNPRIQQVLRLKLKKKRFSFSVWGSLGRRPQVGVFWLFLVTFTWLWTPTYWAIILAQNGFGK